MPSRRRGWIGRCLGQPARWRQTRLTANIPTPTTMRSPLQRRQQVIAIDTNMAAAQGKPERMIMAVALDKARAVPLAA